MDAGPHVLTRSTARVQRRPGLLPVALWCLGIGVALFDAAASASYGRPILTVANLLITPAVYLTTGLIAWRRQPSSLVGPLLMAVPTVPLLALALRYALPEAQAFQIGFNNAGLLIQAYLLLSFPGSRPEGRTERTLLGLSAAIFALYVLATMVSMDPAASAPTLCPPCAPNPLRLFDAGFSTSVELASDVFFVVALVAVTVLVLRRWWRAAPAMRRVLEPVLLGGLVMGAAVLVPEVLERTAPHLRNVAVAGLYMVGILVPIGLLVSFLRLERARASLAGAVVSLGAQASVTGLTNALRATLHDPGLEVVRWSPTTEAFLDQEGRRVSLPDPGATCVSIPLARDGEPVGAVILDAALATDPGLVSAISDAGRFALDAVAIRDELEARGADAASLPTGTVTFLFGDIEGSTELLGRLGDRYVDVLVEVRAVVRAASDAHRGHVVDIRADECFLAFGGSADALAAAETIQRRLAVASWPGGEQVRMRIGLHTGQPALTGHGYVGLDVHLAARVMGAANGGQVLLSGEIAAEAQRSGFALRRLGTYSLRGIPEPVELTAFEVAGVPLDPRLPRAEAVGEGVALADAAR